MAPYGGGAGLGAANLENELRYRQLLAGWGAMGRRAEGYLKGAGEAESRNIQRRYRDMASSAYNSVVGRGFGNSSLMATQQQGIMRGMNEDLGALQERLNQQRLAADLAITRAKSNIIEGRTDTGPNSAQMYQMGLGLGRSGGYSPYGMMHPLQQQWLAAAMQNLMWGRQPPQPRQPNWRWLKAREIRRQRAAAGPTPAPASRRWINPNLNTKIPIWQWQGQL